MILVGPLIVFAMLALGVRSRRAAANLAMLAPLSALAGVGLATWARFQKTTPYDGTYEWLNVGTAFSGPPQFQTYIVDIGIRVSHLTSVLMLCAIAIALAVLAWSRAGARGEPSPARFYGLVTLLFACSLGVIVNSDLSVLFAFWGAGAVATYLLLSNNWADEDSTLAARLALAVPVLSDLALLAGIALLYSRYGQLNLDQLIPQLHRVVGAGPKALATAGILLFIGAAGRLGLFPFHGWLTRASSASTGALAAVQGFWALMAAGLLFKVLPILAASYPANPLPLRVVAATASVSAVVLPLLGLAGLDARRAVTAAGIGLSALAVLGFARPMAVAPAAVLLAAIGLARVAAVLAAGTLAAGMRSPLLSEMGEGLRRMRYTVLALPLAGAGMAGAVGAVAGDTLRWYWLLAYALGLPLGLLALLRVYFVAANAPLPRRRGFDPNRVRPAPTEMVMPPLLLGVISIGLAVALYSTRFQSFLDQLPHHRPATAFVALWLGLPVAGALLAAVLFLVLRQVGNRLAGAAAVAWEGGVGLGRQALDRFLLAPFLGLVGVVEDSGLAGGETRLGRAVGDSARILQRRLPLLPIALGLAVLVVVVAGLFAPGVYR
jgi:NADH-quinone oxidoreductase subunit L